MSSIVEAQERYKQVLESLDQASRQLAVAAIAREEFQERRADAVVEISNLGAPRSVVAKLTGLTRGRVQQILDEAGAIGIAGGSWDEPGFKQLVEQAIKERPLPSIGLGLRRESTTGPHLGAGYGGALRLTGDIEKDREDVTEALGQLLERAKSGEFDDLLTLTDEEREILDGRLID